METTTYLMKIEIAVTCIKSAVVQIRAVANNLDHAYEVARFEYGAIRILAVEKSTVVL